MNLHDIVKRQDRALQIENGEVEIITARRKGLGQRAVRLFPKTRVSLLEIQEFYCLKTPAFRLYWHVQGDQFPETLFAGVISEGADIQVADYIKSTIYPDEYEIQLSSSVEQNSSRMILDNAGIEPVDILIGPQVSLRQKVLELITGCGVEIGPGLNPAVRPDDNIDVSYIERTPPDQWVELYNADPEQISKIPPETLALYRIDDAAAPDHIEPGSLDFVFSNHVMEHLPNFGQVLRNWTRCLRSGGLFCGVVPDMRYSFDLRQTPTTLSEIAEAEKAGGHEITDSHYERWCKWTFPSHTPEGLKKRGYSIHVNYLTASSLSNILAYYCECGLFGRYQIWFLPDSRDIGFAAWAE